MDAVSHLVRRSRRGLLTASHQHFALPLAHVSEHDVNETTPAADLALRKRLTPEQIESMQAVAKASAIKEASEAAAKAATTAKTTTAVATTTTQRVSSATTTSTHSAYAFSDKFATRSTTSTIATSSAVKSSAATSSTVRAVSSAAPSSSIISSSSSTRVTSSTPSTTRTSTSSSAAAPLTSTATVRTITETPSSVSSSASLSASASASAGASAAGSTTDSGVSTGTIAGVVVGVLVGLVLVGSFIGWLYRKYSSRSKAAPWAKINDDDITPFPANEKYTPNGQDDIYGASSAPVIGSRRALAMARQNAFDSDGSFRPASDYMFTEDGANRAGVGSGHINHGYGAYPNLPSPYYGLDPQGRPYSPDASRSPMPHMYDNLAQDSPHAITAPGNTRQLVGPHGFPQPDLGPHAMGRPAPPQSNFAISQHEDFADMPEPLTPDNGDYMPRTAGTMGEWAGDAQHPDQRGGNFATRMDFSSAGGQPATMAQTPSEKEQFPLPHPASLPSFEPMSPLMNEFDFRRNSAQPLSMYEDERTQQKRMYGEVASAANVPEPPTPKTATTSPTSTEPTVPFPTDGLRLPAIQTTQPYVHGRPLSPLAEVQTPLSVATRPSVDYPMPSSSILHEANPYERTLHPTAPSSPAPPYSATSGATLTYPPRSPSGMSVPGSVTDSPQRWNGTEPRGTRVQSMFDEEDAYGGI